MASRSPEPVHLDLTGCQRTFLVRALREWGGPGHPTTALAALVGLPDVDALRADIRRLIPALEEAQPLSERDWTTAVLLAGLMVGNRDVGAPLDWHSCTGQHLEEAWDDLASVERVVRTRFLGTAARRILFSGLHEGRRTRVWTFRPEADLGPVDWREVVTGVREEAEERHRRTHGEAAGPEAWLQVRLDRRDDGSLGKWSFLTAEP